MTGVPKCVGGVGFTDTEAHLHADGPDSLAWQARANAAAMQHARAIPGYSELRARVRAELLPRLDWYTRHRVLGGRHFWLEPSGADWRIRVADEIGGAGRVLVDSRALDDGTGRAVAILFLEPSPDGTRVAFTVSRGGQHVGDWCVVEVATGRITATAMRDYYISNCNLPGWWPDASGFLIGDRAPDGRHAVRFVDTGRPLPPDAPPGRTFGFDEVPPDAPGFSVQVSPRGVHAIGVTEPHQRVARVVYDTRAREWRPFLPAGFGGECHGEWLDDDTYVAVVTHDAPRGRVVAIPVATSCDPATWREIVPASDAVVRTVTVVDGRVVLAELVDVVLRVRSVWPDGRADQTATLPPLGMSAHILVPRRIERSEALLISFASFRHPLTWYWHDFESRTTRRIGAGREPLQDVDVAQQFAVARDGTRIPYFVIRAIGPAPEGPRPTLVNAYGGYNAAWLPMPLEHIVPFLRAGGVYVHANLRGGGEYGRDWYEAGRLARLQTSFDDLYAVAEDLIARGQATPSRLAFQGHSHGGLLAGVALTQRPDLWCAVCPTSPLLDMMEPLLEGPAKAQIHAYYVQHYGDPQDPADAERLYAISPYHRIRDGVSYPAVYAVFGEHDTGCPPFHGRKFISRLQRASASGRPALLRVWENVGHGAIDLEVSADYVAEWLAFVMHEIGLPLRWPLGGDAPATPGSAA